MYVVCICTLVQNENSQAVTSLTKCFDYASFPNLFDKSHVAMAYIFISNMLLLFIFAMAFVIKPKPVKKEAKTVDKP